MYLIIMLLFFNVLNNIDCQAEQKPQETDEQCDSFEDPKGGLGPGQPRAKKRAFHLFGPKMDGVRVDLEKSIKNFTKECNITERDTKQQQNWRKLVNKQVSRIIKELENLFAQKNVPEAKFANNAEAIKYFERYGLTTDIAHILKSSYIILVKFCAKHNRLKPDSHADKKSSLSKITDAVFHSTSKIIQSLSGIAGSMVKYGRDIYESLKLIFGHNWTDNLTEEDSHESESTSLNEEQTEEESENSYGSVDDSEMMRDMTRKPHHGGRKTSSTTPILDEYEDSESELFGISASGEESGNGQTRRPPLNVDRSTKGWNQKHHHTGRKTRPTTPTFGEDEDSGYEIFRMSPSGGESANDKTDHTTPVFGEGEASANEEISGKVSSDEESGSEPFGISWNSEESANDKTRAPPLSVDSSAKEMTQKSLHEVRNTSPEKSVSDDKSVEDIHTTSQPPKHPPKPPPKPQTTTETTETHYQTASGLYPWFYPGNH